MWVLVCRPQKRASKLGASSPVLGSRASAAGACWDRTQRVCPDKSSWSAPVRSRVCMGPTQAHHPALPPVHPAGALPICALGGIVGEPTTMSPRVQNHLPCTYHVHTGRQTSRFKFQADIQTMRPLFANDILIHHPGGHPEEATIQEPHPSRSNTHVVILMGRFAKSLQN